MNSTIRNIISVSLAIATGILTFLGVIIAAILAFPIQIERITAMNSIPFGQWTMVELNLQIGMIALLVIAAFLTTFSFMLVLVYVGGWRKI